MEKCSLIRCIGSEEDEELHYTKHSSAPYLICFDPLDGSSNIDVNITTGTIFAIYRYDQNNEIKNGRNIIMSGYSLYGASTQYLIAHQNELSMYQYNMQKALEKIENFHDTKGYIQITVSTLTSKINT